MATQYNPLDKKQSTVEAIYYLDYSTARLLATVPSLRKVGGKTEILNGFAERDLIADFRLRPARRLTS